MARDRRKRLYDAGMHAILGSTTAAHKVVHRLSGGRLWRRFPGGVQVVWITTLGRRSGRWRTSPLLAVPDPADPTVWVVTGSNAGQDKIPGWVHNIRAHAGGRIRIDDDEWEVRFEEATGPDRDMLYALLARAWRAYSTYEVRSSRYIPVFRIAPDVSVEALD